MRAGDHRSAGIAAYTLARLAYLGGRYPAAGRWLAEALVHFERDDPLGVRIQARALDVGLAWAEGDHEAGAERVKRLHASVADTELLPIQVPHVRRAEGWALRLRSDAEAAKRLLRDAEELDEAPCYAAPLAYEALRAGAIAAPYLESLARRCDSRLVRAYAAHATGKAAHDGGTLLAAAEEMVMIGALRYALEAAADAASTYVREGRQDSARRAAARVRELFAGQGGRPRASTGSTGPPPSSRAGSGRSPSSSPRGSATPRSRTGSSCRCGRSKRTSTGPWASPVSVTGASCDCVVGYAGRVRRPVGRCCHTPIKEPSDDHRKPPASTPPSPPGSSSLCSPSMPASRPLPSSPSPRPPPSRSPACAPTAPSFSSSARSPPSPRSPVVAFTVDAQAADWLARYARGIAAGVLALISFASLAFTPFTEQYARESVPERLWGSATFKAVNRELTTLWACVFTAMIPLHVIAGSLDTRQGNLVLNWLLPITLVVWASKRTSEASAGTPTPAAAYRTFAG